MEFFLALFAAMGLSHIIVDSPLMNPMKNWLAARRHWFWHGVLDMLNCYQCSGVWAGWIIGIMLWLAGGCTPLSAFLLGFANGVFSPISTVIITYFNLKNTEILEKNAPANEEEAGPTGN